MLCTALQSWQWWHRAESFCLGKIMLMFRKLLTTDDEESVEIELKYWACRSWLEHSRDRFKSFLTLLSPRSRQRSAVECSIWPPPLQITQNCIACLNPALGQCDAHIQQFLNQDYKMLSLHQNTNIEYYYGILIYKLMKYLLLLQPHEWNNELTFYKLKLWILTMQCLLELFILMEATSLKNYYLNI